MKIGRLLYSCDGDWFYATGHTIADAHFCYIDADGVRHICVSALEAANYTPSDTLKLYSFQEIFDAIAQRGATLSTAEIGYQLILKQPADVVQIGFDFPAYIYRDLIKLFPDLDIIKDGIMHERVFKTPQEIAWMRDATLMNEQGFLQGRAILEEADIRTDRKLYWKDEPLTSEVLRRQINQVLAARGAHTMGDAYTSAIIAGGEQAAIPHHRGMGQLYAEETIIMDIFPRHDNGYFSDMTRTYVKGQPSQWQDDLYHAVLAAQEAAIAEIKAGVDGHVAHQAACETFVRLGWESSSHLENTSFGFMHSTGHHVGLDLHDFSHAALTRTSYTIEKNMVLTVEPGLYYPKGTHTGGYGGCRIEDLGVVTEDGFDNFTTLSKRDWVIS